MLYVLYSIHAEKGNEILMFMGSGFRVQRVSVAASPQKRKPTPASLRSAAPSKGRGSRGCSLLPLEGGAPEGRRLDGDSGMKESEEMHLKSTINESTLSTADAVPLPQGGRLRGAALRVDFYKGRCPKAGG